MSQKKRSELKFLCYASPLVDFMSRGSSGGPLPAVQCVGENVSSGPS